jgi:orotidine-5'-phosphate decarboxylase
VKKLLRVARAFRLADIAIALDVLSREAAFALIDRLPSAADFFKVGLELFVREGPSFVRELRLSERRVFLDLKLHDIPNTVSAASRASAELEVDLLTVHASGGPRMIEAARAAVEGSRTSVVAVTVLTSLSSNEVSECWGRAGTDRKMEAVRLAHLAVESGAHGVVASPNDVPAIRRALPVGSVIVTPGIRFLGDSPDDHAGVSTPREAVRAGSDVLVIGRSVTRAGDPGDAFRRIRSEISI